MRKISVIGIILVLVMTTLVAGTAGAKSTPGFGDGAEAPVAFNILFDGYCDGFSGAFDGATGLFVGTYTSSCATCPMTDRLAGSYATIYSQGKALTVAFETVGGNPPFIWTVIRANHTWTHYLFDGSVMNTGTWSLCPNAPVPGALPSTTR